MAVDVQAPVAVSGEFDGVDPLMHVFAIAGEFDVPDPIASTVVHVDPPSATTDEFTLLEPQVFAAPTSPDGTQYLYSNVGVELEPEDPAGQYMTVNVGVTLEPSDEAGHYTTMNVGVVLFPADEAGQYLYMNVTDETPTPVIWWLDPNFGQESDQFMVVGKGFGDPQEEYSGIVKLNDDVCTVLVWDREPAAWATPDDPFIDVENRDSNVEYDFVVVIVPSAAESGVVTVETDGP